MTEAGTEPRRWPNYFDEPRAPVSAGLRYGLAALVVAGCGLAAFEACRPHGEDVETAPTEAAILVDLPPALATPAPPTVEAAAPAQPAIQATAATSAAKPPDEVPMRASAGATIVQPPDVPKPTPPAAAQPALAAPAPASSPDFSTDAHEPAEEGRRSRADARAIKAWQRALVGRIERAKPTIRRVGRGLGLTRIAFEIDALGRLVSEHVDRSSGNPALDETALALIAHAAPFPLPPLSARPADLSFIVPVRFGR